MNGQGDGVAPTIITSLDGSVAVSGGGAVDLSVASSATTTPFRLIPVGNGNTNSLVMVDLLVVPGGVTVTGAGDVYLDFDATMQLTIPIGAPPIGTFQLVSTQFLWNGAPLLSSAFAGIVPAQADLFATIAYGVRMQARIPSPGVGNFPLSVQWSVADATCNAATFINNGNLRIEGKF